MRTETRSQGLIATVITWSDSRVPVEIIFDQGIGDLFVVRVAGKSLRAGDDWLDRVRVGNSGPCWCWCWVTRCRAVTAAMEGAGRDGLRAGCWVGPGRRSRAARAGRAPGKRCWSERPRRTIWLDERLDAASGRRARPGLGGMTQGGRSTSSAAGCEAPLAGPGLRQRYLRGSRVSMSGAGCGPHRGNTGKHKREGRHGQVRAETLLTIRHPASQLAAARRDREAAGLLVELIVREPRRAIYRV